MKITVLSPEDRDVKIQRAIRRAAQFIIDTSFNDDGPATRAALGKMHRRLVEDGLQPPPLANFRHAACDIVKEVIKRMRFSAKIEANLN